MQRNPSDALPVSPWIGRYAPLVPKGGSVLDVACGGGRHARFFAARGHRVTGVDRDLSGLSAELRDDPSCEWVAADLEADGAAWPFGDRRFDAVVVTNYLWRPVLARIYAAVDDGGCLLYETFAVGNERFGRPRNPDFLLTPGELLGCRDHGLEVVAFECGVDERPAARMVQRIAATRSREPAVLPA